MVTRGLADGLSTTCDRREVTPLTSTGLRVPSHLADSALHAPYRIRETSSTTIIERQQCSFATGQDHRCLRHKRAAGSRCGVRGLNGAWSRANRRRSRASRASNRAVNAPRPRRTAREHLPPRRIRTRRDRGHRQRSRAPITEVWKQEAARNVCSGAGRGGGR